MRLVSRGPRCNIFLPNVFRWEGSHCSGCCTHAKLMNVACEHLFMVYCAIDKGATFHLFYANC